MGEGRLLGNLLMKGNPRRGVHKIKIESPSPATQGAGEGRGGGKNRVSGKFSGRLMLGLVNK